MLDVFKFLLVVRKKVGRRPAVESHRIGTLRSPRSRLKALQLNLSSCTVHKMSLYLLCRRNQPKSVECPGFDPQY